MACTDGALLGKLKDIVCELEGCSPAGQGQAMVCPPQTQPFAACCMVCPPPILAPTSPQPVKPLELPCPYPTNNAEPEMTPQQAEETRYANFYNNYNVDYRTEAAGGAYGGDPYKNDKSKGTTIDGKNPRCDERLKKKEVEEDQGCPTGFKPCSMKLTPPAGCHPCGVWCAQIQPCPPKKKKKAQPGNC